ncbi:MAG: hypothetical protein K8S55_01305 [Phycisphaerae bacterium]|nr:hypothetical protein [Phycisphaerae bacterium]
MAITVVEKPESRQVTDDSAELIYLITGTASDAEALAALKSTASATHNSMTRGKCSVDPVKESIDSGNADFCKWEGTAPYAPLQNTVPQIPETGDSSFSFDTGGGSQHITQSLSTVNRYAPTGQTAPNFKGAIGVTHDSVEGVDISVPVYNFSETHYIADGDVDKAAYFALTGKTNNAAFKGCAAGECLCLGASGSKRGGGDWEITFRFAASPNKTGLTIGSITGIDKKGWEFLWVRYADTEDTAAKTIVKQPAAVYVEKVYEEGSFSGLGIGT